MCASILFEDGNFFEDGNLFEDADALKSVPTKIRDCHSGIVIRGCYSGLSFWGDFRGVEMTGDDLFDDFFVDFDCLEGDLVPVVGGEVVGTGWRGGMAFALHCAGEFIDVADRVEVGR